MVGIGTVEVQNVSKEVQAKSLIMKAWRERWSEVQWGINIRQLTDASTDGSFLADCILRQALSGPGPNSLVLSYLMHSIHSQIVTTASVLSSVSKYDAFHKPFCVASLLDLLESIKERIILNDYQGKEECMHLALALQSVVCWLLSCMYSSLETLSDVISDFPAEAEDSKIVVKCRNLVDFFLQDPYLVNLIQVANKEDEESFLKIKRMGKEVDKFVDGHHKNDIAHVTSLIDKLSAQRIPKTSLKILPLNKTYDGLQMKVGNPSIQAIIMKAVLLKTSQDIPTVVSELLLVKQLQNLDAVKLYAEIVHSCLMGLVDAFGNKEHELTFVGFTFLQLHALIHAVREKLSDSTDSLVKGLERLIDNESCLNIADTKLHCCTFEFILSSFMKTGMINENDKESLLKLRKSKGHSVVTQSNGQPPVIVRTEPTLLPLLITLDDQEAQKSQEERMNILCQILSDNDKTLMNVILTAAATTGRLQQLTSRLINLNKHSGTSSGENSKNASTRAILFDLTFLMLCYVVQHHGQKALPSDDSESGAFFEEWYHDCMVENNVAKNPDVILSRCDQARVDLILNSHVDNSDMKSRDISLVNWIDLCTNSVGVVRDVLMAWEAESITFTEVRRSLDIFRSKVCAVPVCIAAWLCAYIQVTPEEKCGRAKEILNYLLTPCITSENPDHFTERYTLMNQVITKMMNCLAPNDKSAASSPATSNLYAFESKSVSDLYKQCWACMSKRGLIDVETTFNLQYLLKMSGPHFFVQNLVEEMLSLQHSPELAQRCDLLYGILHYDLKNCTPALIRVVIPMLLQFWTNDSSLMEPQIKALVSLSVDCILSYFYYASTTVQIKEERKDDANEPPSKRRKCWDVTQAANETMVELHLMLKELYEEFHKLLMNASEATPTTVFILQFLEHLSLKSPTLTLLTSLPHQVVTRLMSLMSDDMNPEVIIGLFCLTNKPSRLNCARALCCLKHARYANENYHPRSFSPAPGC